NKILKMETKLWNLTVKGNDMTAYNQRFQELTLLYTKMSRERRIRLRSTLEVFWITFKKM
ncbi:hypothetical protein Tco_0426549, partial [Tanacetum coccineum]